MIRKALVGTIVALIVVLSLSTLNAADHPVAKVGQAAPQFSLKDENGKAVNLSDYKGKIIVLEWTNPDCPFVQRHYQQHTMTNLASQYKDKGVVWLAINSNGGDNTKADSEWAQQNHLQYPVLDDSEGQVAKAYQAKSTPDMFIINKDGLLAYEGGIDNDPDGDNAHRVNYVQKALDEILANKSVSTPVTKSYGCGVHYK
jgi:peroxiredoxin